MKSKIAVSILSLSVAILSLALGGCSGNGTESNSSSGVSQSTENNNSSSDESAPVDEPPVESTPSTPSGEPTFLICPDGTPVYTSEISEIYSGSEFQGNKKTITLEQAEQIAQTGDGGFAVKCDGFIFGYIPEKALNRIDNPELFEARDNGKSFEYLGETSDKNGMYGKRMTDFTRFNIGDKIGEFTVKNAYTLFNSNKPYVPGAHISSYYIELDGAIELEGYICVTPTDTLYGEGGDMRFLPNGDSSKKLPGIGCNWDDETNEYYHCTNVRSEGYIGNWNLVLGNMYKVDCDTSGLQPGDSMVKAKISLENLRYASSFMNGWEFDLKNIELL